MPLYFIFLSSFFMLKSCVGGEKICIELITSTAFFMFLKLSKALGINDLLIFNDTKKYVKQSLLINILVF